jgi:G:T-mismatch repair DNA endonuclease (very short patch repair protein)
MDVLTPEQRHYNMSQIHSKNTKPELIVRKWLWYHGYRYRLHKKIYPENRTLYFLNTMPLSLFTVVSGTGITVDLPQPLPREGIFGNKS